MPPHAKLVRLCLKMQRSQSTARIPRVLFTIMNGPGNAPTNLTLSPSALTPATAKTAPPNFEALPAWRLVLDAVHWCNFMNPVQVNDKWAIGAALRPLNSPLKYRPPPPSVGEAIVHFTSGVLYEGAMPFQQAPEAKRESPLSAYPPGSIGNIATIQCHPPACIPVSTVEHDRTQLIWNDPNHLCASGQSCAAVTLPFAPGPLPFFVLPGEDRKLAEGPRFCLLCIRADCESVCRVYDGVVRHSQAELGRAAVALAPFQNLVNVPNGYRDSALGVKPSQHIFAPVAVASAHIQMLVRTRPDGTKYVDQSAAEWQPEHNHFL